MRFPVPAHHRTIRSAARFIALAAITVSTMPSDAFAAGGSCEIKNAPSAEVKAYLKGVNEFAGAVRKKISGARCDGMTDAENGGATADVESGANRALASVNRALTAENVFTSFRFTADLIRRTELPPAIRRDYSVLSSRQKTIDALFGPTFGNCANELVLDENIAAFSMTDTTGAKLGDVLESFLQNHVNVMEAYREAVIGNPSTVTDLPFVPGGRDAFVAGLERAYGPSAVEVCNASDPKSFYATVTEAVNRIGNLGGGIERGMQDWKHAWGLINGSEKMSAERERSMLRRELSRQGLSTSRSERALRNFDEYNQGNGWQGIHSSVSAIGDTVARAVHIAKSLYVDAKKALEESKTSDEYVERLQNVQTVQTDVGADIATEYERYLAIVGTENVASDENLGQLMEMHALVSKTVKSLEPAVRSCQETCNAQVSGLGNCRGE